MAVFCHHKREESPSSYKSQTLTSSIARAGRDSLVMRSSYCRYGSVLRGGSTGLRAAPHYSFSEKVCQEVLEKSMTCCFYGLSFGGLNLLCCSRQSTFGEECARWFERAKSPHNDPTATLAGAVRKDQRIPQIRDKKNNIRNFNSKKKSKGQ